MPSRASGKKKRKRKAASAGPADELLQACKAFDWTEQSQLPMACAVVAQLFAESDGVDLEDGVELALHRRRLHWAKSFGVSRRLLGCIAPDVPLALRLHAVSALINMHAVGGTETCERAVEEEGAVPTLASELERSVASAAPASADEAAQRRQLIEQLLVLLNDLCHGALGAVAVFTEQCAATTLPVIVSCVALAFGAEGDAHESVARAAATLLHTATDGNGALALQLLALPGALRLLSTACAREEARYSRGDAPPSAADGELRSARALTCLHYAGAMGAAWEASSAAGAPRGDVLTPIVRVVVATLGAHRAKGSRVALPPAWPPTALAAADADGASGADGADAAAAAAAAGAAEAAALLPWTRWVESLTLAVELLANLSIMAQEEGARGEEEGAAAAMACEEDDDVGRAPGSSAARAQLGAALGAAHVVEATLGVRRFIYRYILNEFC